MKKTIALSMALLLIILCICFSGCDGSGGKSNKIAITAENFEQYATLSLRGYGSDYRSGAYSGYRTLNVNGSITGVSGWTYENVSVKIRVVFKGTSYGGVLGLTEESVTQTVWVDTISLNVGGNATVAYSENATNSKGEKSVIDDLDCLGYEIVAVEGYVVQN